MRKRKTLKSNIVLPIALILGTVRASGLCEGVSFMPTNMVVTRATDILGMPSLHVPNSKDSLGMPIGFQITSAKYNDYLILQLLDVLIERNYLSDRSLLTTTKSVSLDG